MPRFRIDVIGSSGGVERLLIEAADDLAAARYAFQKGGVPVAIHPIRDGLLGRLQNPVGGSGGINASALALFAEQMAELLNAGLALEQALQLLSTQDKGSRQSRLAARLLGKIRTGETLSLALSQEQGVPALFIGIVQGAERSGALAMGFATVSQYLERQNEISRRIRAALAYPAVVLAVTIFAVFFILAVVIPEFAPLFSGEEKHLPLVTRVVLFLSELLVNQFPVLLSALVTVGIGSYWSFARIAPVRASMHRALMRLPPVQYAIRLELARTIQVLGALLSSGVEASEAMELAAAVPSNALIRQQFSNGARLLREGCSVAETFSTIPLLPQSVATLIAVGEQSGELGRVATRSALVLEADTNRRIDRFLATLNPAAVISLGGLVALLIASVMLGILSINQLALR